MKVKNFLSVFISILALSVFFSYQAWALVSSGTCTVKDDRDDHSIPFTLRHRVEHGANLTQNGPCKTKIKFEEGEAFPISLQSTLTFMNSAGLVVDGAGATVTIKEGTVSSDQCLFDVNQNPNMWFKNMTIEAPSHLREKVICGDHDEENVTIISKNPAVCGNGNVEDGEACDNTNGCCTSCQFASEGTSCSGAPNGKCNDSGQCVTPPPSCGDGNKDPGEDCDGGQCCTPSCDFAPGGTSCNDGLLLTVNDQCNDQGECHGTPIVFSICGDGQIDSGEVCDDGNVVNDDGCSSTCQVEAGWTCTTANPSVCTLSPVCGNGTVEGTEVCDDADTDSGDGCSATCTVETGYTCAGTSPSICTANPPAPVCGDGIVNTATGEQCDNNSECCENCLVVSAGTPCNGDSGNTCGGQGLCQETPTSPNENPSSNPCSAKFRVNCGVGGGCSLGEVSGSPLGIFLLSSLLSGFLLGRPFRSRRK